MDENLRRAWRDFFEKNVSEDTWFATLQFIFHIPLSPLKKRIKTWLRRIELSLIDLGHIPLSNRPSERLWAIVGHSPSNTHAHLLITAKGLSNLDKARWEERWKDIMGHKGETPTCVIYTAWKDAATSYMTKWFNLGDGSEIWFRGLPPQTSAKQIKVALPPYIKE